MPLAGNKRSLEKEEDDITPSRPRKRPVIGKSIAPEPIDPKSAHSAVHQSPGPVQESLQKHSKLPADDQTFHSDKSHIVASDTQRPPKRPANDEDQEPCRPRKRPGAAARISKEDKEAILARQKQREEEALKAATTRGVHDAVRQHYNAVPQRGRDWRSTESRIKGLRKFNNWVKSTLIHRFSPPDSDLAPPLRVLDLGCGKGGDLGKWQSAPHPLDIYIGIDPAEVSIDQARDRYSEMSRGGRGGRGGRAGYRGGRPQQVFDAEFIVQDAFGQSISKIPIVRNIGFAEDGGSRWTGGGFDVVSMMFCMHYAFESEAKAKGMLANVAGSLKKGGRFLGVIPNSDIIRSRVEAFHKQRPTKHTSTSNKGNDKNEVMEPSEVNKVISPVNATGPVDKVNNEENLNQEGKSRTSVEAAQEAEVKENGSHTASQDGVTSKTKDEFAEWGNSIYKVRFPGTTPEDGVFRPPYGWKYNYFMEEAVEEVPEYVVPWEAFRA